MLRSSDFDDSAFDAFKEKFARIVVLGRDSDGFEIINPKPCSDDCAICRRRLVAQLSEDGE